MFVKRMKTYLWNNLPINIPHEFHMYPSSKCFLHVYWGVATEGARGPWQFPLQFPNQTRSNSFSFKHQGYCFLRVFRNFTIFTVYTTIFGQFTAAFHFFILRRGNRSLPIAPSGKVRCVTLDLLKKFLIVDHPKEGHNELEFKR